MQSHQTAPPFRREVGRDETASPHHERRIERLIDRLPGRPRMMIHWLRRPSLRWVRVVAGVLFIAGSFLSILPIFGIWMLPLGLILLAEDIPAAKSSTSPLSRRPPRGSKAISGVT